MTLVNAQKGQIKYGELKVKLAVEKTCNKICVYLISIYTMHIKGGKKYLTLKFITIIDTITGWFEIK